MIERLLTKTFLYGLRDGAGLPGLALGSAVAGYGAIARESGLDLLVTLASVVALWALPALLTFAEVWANGGGPVVMAAAVLIANIRALPMIVAALPLVRREPGLKGNHFLLAQMVSPSNWAQAAIKHSALVPAERTPYFVGFSLSLWCAGVIGSSLGHLFAADLPPALELTVLFLTPLFVLLMMSTARRRSGQVAVVIGAILVPATMELSVEWGMLVGGIVAGTAGFFIGRAIMARTGRRAT